MCASLSAAFIESLALAEVQIEHPIPGLYAAGEIVGDLFFHNYASGTGLMPGASSAALPGEVLRGMRRVGEKTDVLKLNTNYTHNCIW